MSGGAGPSFSQECFGSVSLEDREAKRFLDYNNNFASLTV
jgi:hypothetical protein